MKSFVFLLLLTPFAVQLSFANIQCPAGSWVTCHRESSSQKTCITPSILSLSSKKKICTKICQDHQTGKDKFCLDNCPSDKCSLCLNDVEKTVQECRRFHKITKKNIRDCDTLERSLIHCCMDPAICKVCHHTFCQNGGVCKGGPNVLSCKCPQGFTGAFCQNSQCNASHQCQNGGTCVGPSTCACIPDYTGPQCRRKKLGTKLNPAPNAQAILDAGDSVGSGLYWIQPPGEDIAAQTYCDMTYADGGWMMASYGYVASASSSSSNKAIPNMNNPMGYAWQPDKRAGLSGVINLPHGAVMMARKATYMIMAAGNNPTTGIDQYQYVYKIDLRQNTYKITFSNHNRFHGAIGANGIPKMHVTDFLVIGLKGDIGFFERFAFGESLGVTWSDSYPSGYGFNDIGIAYGSWSKGPFFPSVHSGDGRGSCSGGLCRTYQPDISLGSESYAHRGWYTASGAVGKTGQTSIWFK